MNTITARQAADRVRCAATLSDLVREYAAAVCLELHVADTSPPDRERRLEDAIALTRLYRERERVLLGLPPGE